MVTNTFTVSLKAFRVAYFVSDLYLGAFAANTDVWQRGHFRLDICTFCV